MTYVAVQVSELNAGLPSPFGGFDLHNTSQYSVTQLSTTRP
jgi:hypothetical protein